jgi:hypothetical protein
VCEQTAATAAGFFVDSAVAAELLDVFPVVAEDAAVTAMIELVPAVHVDLVKHPSVTPERSVAPEDPSQQAAAKLDCSHKEGSVSEASVLNF